MNPKRLLSDEDGDRIASAVRGAESRTSGEIRILVVGQSMRWIRLPILVAGLAAGGLAAWRAVDSAWGHPRLPDIAFAGAVGLGVMAVLSGAAWISPLRRSAVRRRAEREFVRLGIARTRERTGVLLMLSLRERTAQLLADRAIDGKVPPGTWNGIVRELADGVRHGRPVDAICAAVEKIGTRLAEHFPRRADDANELSDRPEEAP